MTHAWRVWASLLLQTGVVLNPCECSGEVPFAPVKDADGEPVVAEGAKGPRQPPGLLTTRRPAGSTRHQLRRRGLQRVGHTQTGSRAAARASVQSEVTREMGPIPPRGGRGPSPVRISAPKVLVQKPQTLPGRPNGERERVRGRLRRLAVAIQRLNSESAISLHAEASPSKASKATSFWPLNQTRQFCSLPSSAAQS